jgi:hypothetical protein
VVHAALTIDVARSVGGRRVKLEFRCRWTSGPVNKKAARTVVMSVGVFNSSGLIDDLHSRLVVQRWPLALILAGTNAWSR